MVRPRVLLADSLAVSRIRASLLLFVALAPLTMAMGCRESTAGAAAAGVATELSGRWMSARSPLAPEAWHQTSITFTMDGRFISENRTYGLYEGQQHDALSAFTRAEGLYRVEGGHLSFEPKRLVSWDRFNGEFSPEHIEEPYPFEGLFDDARYAVEGDNLTLRFVVYPADAPVPVVAKYVRVR